MKNVTVKSVDFFNEKDQVIKGHEFSTPVKLDSTAFNDVTPIEGYLWCLILNEEGSEILLDYSEISLTSSHYMDRNEENKS